MWLKWIGCWIIHLQYIYLYQYITCFWSKRGYLSFKWKVRITSTHLDTTRQSINIPSRNSYKRRWYHSSHRFTSVIISHCIPMPPFILRPPSNSLKETRCAAATFAAQKMNDGRSNKARCCEPDECRTSLGFLTSGFHVVKRSLSTRVGLAGPGDEWVVMITQVIYIRAATDFDSCRVCLQQKVF